MSLEPLNLPTGMSQRDPQVASQTGTPIRPSGQVPFASQRRGALDFDECVAHPLDVGRRAFLPVNPVG